MRMLLGTLATCAGLVLGAAAPAAPVVTPTPSYTLAASIPLPDGRWDLVSFDASRRQVLIARGENVTVVNLATGRTRTLGTIARGHSVVAIAGTQLFAVTSGGDNTVRLLDGADGHETARIPVGSNPDASLYDAATHRLIVMNAKGGTLSVIDPRSAKVIGTIPVKPALELGVMIGPSLLAINDEDANEVELVDLKVGHAGVAIPLPGCTGPTGIAFDANDQLLLSTCANGQAALVDLRTRRLLRLIPIGSGPDTALFDPHLHRFLVPCGRSGTLSVISVGRNRQTKVMPTVTTEVGARTAALDPGTGRIFLPTARFENGPPGTRPGPVSGTVHLLVLAPTD